MASRSRCGPCWGQQISVKAAHTLAGRLVEAFGDACPTPFAALHHLFPPPERLAALDPAALADLRHRAQRRAAALGGAGPRGDLGCA